MSLILNPNLRNVPMEVREAFKETHFVCECGGTVLPYNMEWGACISCSDDLLLAELDYEAKD